jgi:hypothetical protein
MLVRGVMSIDVRVIRKESFLILVDVDVDMFLLKAAGITTPGVPDCKMPELVLFEEFI